MGKNWYLVTIESERELSEFLFACLERATSFRAYFPDDPNIGNGREVFSALSQGAVSEWEGMANCLQVSAPLDFVSRELFKLWMIPADDRKRLWQYELLHGGEVFFRAEDFSVYMLFASEAEVEGIRQRGIDTSLWETISMEGEQGPVVQPLSEDEGSELEGDLGELGEDIEDQEPEH